MLNNDGRTLQKLLEETVDKRARVVWIFEHERIEQDFGARLSPIYPGTSESRMSAARGEEGREKSVAPDLLVKEILRIRFPLANVLRCGEQVVKNQGLDEVFYQVLCSIH